MCSNLWLQQEETNIAGLFFWVLALLTVTPSKKALPGFKLFNVSFFCFCQRKLLTPILTSPSHPHPHFPQNINLAVQLKWSIDSALLPLYCYEMKRTDIYFFKILFILFLDRGRKRRRERSVCGCLSLGTWPATQARALTGNRTSDPLIRRLVLNPLSHTSQGCYFK